MARVACVPKALTQGLGLLNRLKDRLVKNRVPQHVGEDCGGLDGTDASVGGPPSRFRARNGL